MNPLATGFYSIYLNLSPTQEPSRYYTLSGLQPETSYVVCFDSVPDGDGSGGSGGMCKELKTLPELTETTTDGELGKRASQCGLIYVSKGDSHNM